VNEVMAARAACSAAQCSSAVCIAARRGIIELAAPLTDRLLRLPSLRIDRPLRRAASGLTGTRTVLDVLVGEQQLFTTQAQLVTAEDDTAIAEFNVAAAIGRLIAPELRLPVRLYDMERHYRAVKDKWIGFAGGVKE